MAGSLGMFLGVVCSNLVEFFYTMWVWNYAAAWAFKEKVSLPATAVKVYYAPHAFDPEDPEELAFWITGCRVAAEMMPSVWEIFHKYLVRAYELSRPKWNPGIDPDYNKVYGVAAPVLWDTDWGRDLQGFYRDISTYQSAIKSSYMGFQGWSPIKELITPKIPVFYSLAPCILELTVFWDELNKSGRVAAAVVPITPWYITVPIIRPIVENNVFVRFIYFLSPGSLAAKPKGIVRRGQVGIRGRWAYEVMEGVTKDPRLVTSGPANVFFGWCLKLLNFIVAQGVKFAPPLSPTIEKLLQYIKPVWRLVLYLMRLMPVAVPFVIDTGPLAVDWQFNLDVWNQIAASPVPRWVRTTSVITTGQAVLVATLSNRTLLPNMKVFAGKSKEWPGAGVHQTCEECPCPHAYLMVMLPNQACELVAEDDPGTVIEASGTNANEDGAYWAFINWVPSIAPTVFARVWAEYSETWNEIAGSFDNIVDSVLGNVADYLEDNPIAPFSKSTISAAWAICCYSEALQSVAPDRSEVESAVANGSIVDLVADLLARLIAFMVVFLSLYLGGGPPGLLLLWWTPNYSPPTFISRSPSMATINPFSVAFGTLELLFSLPFVLAEKAEDVREGLERFKDLYIKGESHPMTSHLSPGAREIQQRLPGSRGSSTGAQG